MDDRQPTPRATRAYNWLEIRKDHACGMSVAAIARKYGLRRETVQNRAKREGWTHQNAQLAQLATKRAHASVAGKVAEVVAEGLMQHAEIEALLLNLSKKMLDKAMNADFHVIKGSRSTDVEAMQRSIEAAKCAIETSRVIHGLRATDKSVQGEDDEAAGKIYEVAYESETA